MASTGGTIPFNPTPRTGKKAEVVEKYKDMRGALIPVFARSAGNLQLLPIKCKKQYPKA